MAIFGHMGEPALTRLCGIARKRLAVEQDRSAYRLSDAGDRFEKLALAVARYSGDPDDLAGPDTERHIIDTHDAFGILDGQISHFEHDALGPARAFFNSQEHPP